MIIYIILSIMIIGYLVNYITYDILSEYDSKYNSLYWRLKGFLVLIPYSLFISIILVAIFAIIKHNIIKGEGFK